MKSVTPSNAISHHSGSPHHLYVTIAYFGSGSASAGQADKQVPSRHSSSIFAFLSLE
jgi:hypothetical protein